MTTSLTSRERVQRAMERRDHDRVPRFDTFWDDTLDRWMKEGLSSTTRESATHEILMELKADLCLIEWYKTQPFPEQHTVLSEDEETRISLNSYGSTERLWKNKNGTPEHLAWDCDSRDKWERIYKSGFVAQPIQVDVKACRRKWEAARQRDQWTFLSGLEPFEVLRRLVGDEMSMISLLDDPEWIMDVAETTTTTLLRNFQAVFDAGIKPDGLWIYGDMAFKTMTFCSPATYKELIWPQHRRLADWAHARDLKMIYHSDGDLRKVMDLYVEAGFDCLQPLESKASMDVRELAPQYGDQLSFLGNIDVMKMITEDLDLIEEEIRTKFAAGMTQRGYLYHSDHSVPPQVSLQTYRAIIELVNRYGTY